MRANERPAFENPWVTERVSVSVLMPVHGFMAMLWIRVPPWMPGPDTGMPTTRFATEATMTMVLPERAEPVVVTGAIDCVPHSSMSPGALAVRSAARSSSESEAPFFPWSWSNVIQTSAIFLPMPEAACGTTVASLIVTLRPEMLGGMPMPTTADPARALKLTPPRSSACVQALLRVSAVRWSAVAVQARLPLPPVNSLLAIHDRSGVATAASAAASCPTALAAQ